MDFTLTKQERLSSVKDIETLVRKGNPLYMHPIKAIVSENGCGMNRIVVSVPKRLFKRAVKRNLLKRRIREGYRLNKHILLERCPGITYDILFVYTGKEISGSEAIHGKIVGILEKITVFGTPGDDMVLQDLHLPA